MIVEAKRNTQINYGSFDVNRLQGLKARELDLNGFWSQIDKKQIFNPVLVPTGHMPFFYPDGTMDHRPVVYINTPPLFVISDEAVLRVGEHLWRHSGLQVQGLGDTATDLGGVFLAVCTIGANLTSEQWNDFLLKDDQFRFRNINVRQFAYMAWKYDHLKRGFIESSGDDESGQQFALQEVGIMESKILNVLEATSV